MVPNQHTPNYYSVYLSNIFIEDFKLNASMANSTGGKKKDSSNRDEQDQDDAAPFSSERSEIKRNPKEDPNSDIADLKRDESITDPNSDLTGDTGNLNLGQTDLGASGIGSENL